MPRRRRKESAGEGEQESKGVEASAGESVPADVFRVAFYRVKKASTLVRRLQVAHTALGELTQDERPGEIELVGQLLATEDFVKHKNKVGWRVWRSGARCGGVGLCCGWCASPRTDVLDAAGSLVGVVLVYAPHPRPRGALAVPRACGATTRTCAC